MPRSSVKPIPIPNIPTRTVELEVNDYSKGMNNYIANDALGNGLLRLAQNARMPSLGEYQTRKGVDVHSEGAGKATADSETSLTGTSDKSFSTTQWLAQKCTVTTSRLGYVELRTKNDASASGNADVLIYTNNAGVPGTLVSRTTISASLFTASYVYLKGYFYDSAQLTAGDYWIVTHTQIPGSGSYKISGTTNSTDALLSTNSGTTWAAQSYSLNFSLYTYTDTPVTGLMRAYKGDGTTKTLFTASTNLYSVNDVTGALTTVKSGLNASMSYWRAVSVNDLVYHVNGYDGLRKWDFTTESQVNASNYSHIALHVGLLFLVDKNDPNKLIFSNFADYETFTSTDFIYVPAPKTGDPITALVPLNGFLVIFTRYSKYILYGTDNATFQLEQAPGIKGTFTQESVTSDKNNIYFMSDDGVYRTNGSEDVLVSKANYNAVKDIATKERTVLNENKGRLYVWFPQASSSNSLCFVYNLNFNSLESYDTNTYVSRAITTIGDDNNMLVGSSLTGLVSWQELDDNDYCNTGQGYEFRLSTHSMHFGTPSREKEIRFWKPRFSSSDADYSISCQYALNLSDGYITNGLSGTIGGGYLWGDSGTVWGSFTWGTTHETQSDLSIGGSYRRVAVSYMHDEPRQPHTFLGHTFVVEMRDLH